MSMSRDITLATAIANKGEIEDALLKLSEFDADFSGDNGDEYLWDIAREKGFETNAEYLISTLKDVESPERKAEEFFKGWIEDDGYYQDYQYAVNEVGDKVVVSLAFV